MNHEKKKTLDLEEYDTQQIAHKDNGLTSKTP